MNRFYYTLGSVALILFLRPSVICQTQAPPTKPSPKAKQDACGPAKQISFDEGWKRGADSVRKDAWGDGFATGMKLEETIYSVQVGDAPKIQKISILVEDIDGSTAYQFAAAEVIRSYFADSLSTVSGSDLTLHIGGTKSMALSYGADVQSIDVEVAVPANQTLAVGDEKRLIHGSLQLASGGGTLKGYSQAEKTQAVREYIYKVLSEYKQKWDQAAPKPSQQSGGF